MIELLKEAREILGDCYSDGKYPLSEGTMGMVAKVIKRINAALAKPAPDAMEIVRMIRSGSPFSSDGNPYLTDKEAAALIESRRVVPRAIDTIAGKLDEAIGEEDWNEAKSALNDLWDLRDDKYGVEVEG